MGGFPHLGVGARRSSIFVDDLSFLLVPTLEVLQSVSGGEWPFGPMFGVIVANAPGATQRRLEVTQWVDEGPNPDGVTDWLAEAAAAVNRCARRIRGEVATVQRAVSAIEEFRAGAASASSGTWWASTPWAPPWTAPPARRRWRPSWTPSAPLPPRCSSGP